jgi:competence protein ComEC
MASSKIFLYFCLSFIGGIFFSSMLGFLPGSREVLLLPGLISGIFLISVLWPYKKLVIIGFCILFLLLGIWRHQIAELKTMNNELRRFNDLEENITLIGIVSAEPDAREANTKLTVKVDEVQTETGSLPVDGKVLVTTQKYPQYQYGDKLRITGNLLTPKEFEDFNYKDYLAKDGIYSVIYWPEIELIKEDQGSFVFAKILRFKNKLRETIYQNLSPPQSSILGAMILGDKSRMSENLKEKLNITGVRHITAISGMHIMILSGILMLLGLSLGLWRSQAFYFALILLCLFIIMVGLPASAIRAGIMGGLFLWGQKMGRLSSSSRAIVIAAALMLAVNPLLLRLDVGFQLSFLAVMGIIYLMPSFQNWFKFLPNPGIFPLRSLLSMTLAAQVFTLPILIYNFGYMSLVSPFTNILIVPLLPYIMASGFIFGLIGMIFQPLGWILSLPCWLLLAYLKSIVDFFSQISWASLTLGISWAWLAISYLILGLITWRLNEKQKLKFLEY